jgi:hypothetical protein
MPEQAAKLERPPHLSPKAGERYREVLENLERRFSGVPISVSFRQLVGPLPAQDAPHNLYPYPARLLRHIPRFAIGAFTAGGDVDAVVDPFCGSGTVLVEAQRHGLDSLGIDSNPVAALISRVKTSHALPAAIVQLGAQIAGVAKARRKLDPPADYLNRWHSPSALSALSRISQAISTMDDSPESDALRLAFALTVRESSVMDHRIPVPVADATRSQNAPSSVRVWQMFERHVDEVASRLDCSVRPRAEVRLGDARTIASHAQLESGRWAMVTSPPYGAAQKYARATSLEAGWLGFTHGRGVAEIEARTIGREHLTLLDEMTDPLLPPEIREVVAEIGSRNPSRARIYAHYFSDMRRVAQGTGATSSVKEIVLIAGTNSVAGEEIATHELLARLFETEGFTTNLVLADAIRGRTLLTARASGARPARSEYVYFMSRTR